MSDLSQPAAKAWEDITILYVEDEPAEREEMLTLLRRRTPDVVSARDGQEGLLLYEQHLPDVVITDIRMPGMNGLAMIKALRAVAPDMVVVVTTAHSDTRYLVEAIELGVDHYVFKPVDTQLLLAAVDKGVATVRLRRAARAHAEERDRLVAELQTALARVKTLRGLLPTCAACKRIRDDRGNWWQMEAYVRDHSDAEFSHGICPDCRHRLYPDFPEK